MVYNIFGFHKYMEAHMSYLRFCELVSERGTSVYKVSKDTGIPPSTFTDWKNGRSAPKAEKMKRIADYFGVTLDSLLSDGKSEETVRSAMPMRII